MKFSDYPYTRPDLNQLQNEGQALIEAMQEAENYEAFKASMNQYIALQRDFFTQSTLVSIRHSINTTDEFYTKEKDFFDENGPHFEAINSRYYQAILNTPYLDQLQLEVPQSFLKLIECQNKAFSPEIIGELQEENKLISSYDKLIASAKIEFDGKTNNLSQMGVYTQSFDRQVRKAASEAVWNFFKENQKEIDNYFDQLVKVRHRIGQKLGYSNFIEVGYLRMTRLDYNQEMVQQYRQKILEEIVPINQKLYAQQAQRLGLEKLSYYDVLVEFPDGNPKPIGSPEDIVASGREMYHELSPETGEFIDLMLDYELMDLLTKPNKQGGGYMTFLFNFERPFIFSNFNGTSGDIDVLTHEAGHAFQGYRSRWIEYPEILMPTYEACEIHSMSMEFITWPYMEKFFGAKADRYRYLHLGSALKFLPYGALVDHFQHEVYANPHYTPEERNELWKRLDAQYRPHLDYSENEFAGSGVYWYRQSHIFQMPFYYIDYTLAQVVALQFWQRLVIEKDEQAWGDYLHLCDLGGTKSFLQLVEEAHLNSPFEAETIPSIAQVIETYLENIDINHL